MVGGMRGREILLMGGMREQSRHGGRDEGSRAVMVREMRGGELS